MACQIQQGSAVDGGKISRQLTPASASSQTWLFGGTEAPRAVRRPLPRPRASGREGHCSQETRPQTSSATETPRPHRDAAPRKPTRVWKGQKPKPRTQLLASVPSTSLGRNNGHCCPCSPAEQEGWWRNLLSTEPAPAEFDPRLASRRGFPRPLINH